jgi:peroxiredoxin
MEEISGFEASLAQFEAANAHVVGVSADPVAKLEDFTKNNQVKHLLLSDADRKMLPAYGAMVTDQKSPMHRLAKRAYFIVDRQGVVRFTRVQANPLDILKTEEVLKVLKGLGS